MRVSAASVLVLAVMALPPACRRESRPGEGPLRFETRRFERILPGCGDLSKREEPCVSFHVSWPEAVGGAPPQALTRINAAVLASLQPLEAPRGFEAEAEQWIGDYRRFHEEFPDSSVTYFARRTASVLFQSATLVTIETRTDEFRGGAEPETRRVLLNLSPSTGLAVDLDSLLEPGAKKDLLRLAEWRFRQERRIPAGGSLSEAGFTFEGDEFALPRQWGFSKSGLVLHYNAGEAGPPSLGATTVVAPWNELRGIIRARAGILPK
ncbi:MAG: RsiV family protein [Bryobacteraceae bacterium]